MKSSISLGMLACVVAIPLFPSCSSTKATSKSMSKVAFSAKTPNLQSATPETGIASIYTDHRTASGDKYSATALAAAHRKYPMGTKLKVTNLDNGKTCEVKVNDRGPYVKGRIIDLTPAAAKALGFGQYKGLTNVRITKL